MAGEMNVGGIKATLQLDSDGFKKGMEEAKQDMRKVTDESKKFNQDFRGVSKSVITSYSIHYTKLYDTNAIIGLNVYKFPEDE